MTVGAAEPLTLTLRRAVEIASSPEGSARIQIADEAVKQAEARSKSSVRHCCRTRTGTSHIRNKTREPRAFGLRLQTPIPGFHIPTFVGPFSTIDVRATGSQSVLRYTRPSSDTVIEGCRLGARRIA